MEPCALHFGQSAEIDQLVSRDIGEVFVVRFVAVRLGPRFDTPRVSQPSSFAGWFGWCPTAVPDWTVTAERWYSA